MSMHCQLHVLLYNAYMLHTCMYWVHCTVHHNFCQIIAEHVWGICRRKILKDWYRQRSSESWNLYYNVLWALYHIPSSCMIIMVHVVKGRQHSAHIQCPNHGDGVSRPWKWQISMLRSQRWIWQRITAFKVQIGRVVDSLLYSAG